MSEPTPKVNENEKLSSALNEIFSNPQMMSAISSMAQSLKNGDPAKAPTEEKSEATAKTALPSSATDKLPELLNMLSSSSSNSNIKQSHRSELLCALKPYLSQNRSDAIDKIIRFSELSSIFKKFS